jgi:1,4-dihydroxy-2-naphthoate octaprenyltransferase
VGLRCWRWAGRHRALLATAAVLLLVVGAVGGWVYSVGPFPLAWHGLGEIDNAVLGGMVLPLYGVAIAGGSLDMPTVATFTPLALVVGANLLATTWPDRLADASVGKWTLATRWPIGRLRATYAIVAVAAIVLLLFQAIGPGPLAVAVGGLTVAPLLAAGLATYTRIESPVATVAAMLWLIAAQLLAWWTIG